MRFNMETPIKKYNNWKNQFTDTSKVTVFEYISFNVHPEDVLIISSLFFPNLVEVNGAVFLEMQYSYNSYLSWLNHFGSDRQALEKMMNHVHMYDIFGHSNNVDDTVYEQVGMLLQIAWTKHFKSEYPDKNIVVDYWHGEDDYGPIVTVFQK
jgi:hypothetical protein